MENNNPTPPQPQPPVTPPPGSFEQNFIQMVKSDQPITPGGAPEQPREKKKLDKRFLIIGALALVLIATIIAAITLNSAANNTSGNSSKPTGENEEKTASIVGIWSCNDEIWITFDSKGKYNFESNMINSTGVFSSDGKVVEMEGQTDTGESVRFSKREIKIDGDSLTLTERGLSVIECKRVKE